ncbi:MAG: polyphosphate kinase 1 [Bacteroidia bacterium]|nr:polyphosphate kinase 1 [Bacteroidia bacterium]
MKKTYLPKEISWLYFNARVLQEAENPNVPLIERIKYLGIYSSNLDEYFRVRIATLKRLAEMGKKAVEIIGYDPKATLKEIHDIVLEQRSKFEYIYTLITHELRKENIFMINEKHLTREQEEFVGKYFQKEVRPKLMPIMIGHSSHIPNLKDQVIYFAVCFGSAKSHKENFALMEIPTNVLPRFLELPSIGIRRYIIMLDDIVRWGMKNTFSIFEFDHIEAYTIKLTKDAEIDIVDNVSDSYLENVAKSLKKRKQADAVSFVYDQQMPATFLNLVMKRFQFKNMDAVIPGGRYHNFKDFIKFPHIGRKELFYDPFPAILHKDLVNKKSFLSVIREKDVMLHFPYHSFDYFIDLLREASIDPKVTSIHITLYRLAKSSSVVNALINAVRNGKDVTAVVELQARFDEEANIFWSNTLRDEGVKIIFGVPWLKVHAKLCLITRKEDKRFMKYACLGSGNYNEDTAKIYTDDLLMTTDTKIINEVEKVFGFFRKNYTRDNYYHLLVAPFTMRNKFIGLLKNEIKNAKKGHEAYIILKLNNLVDEELINLLYEASKAGVKIKLMIRGTCSLIPGVNGLSENIEARAIIDRFLEHSRILIFCNNGDKKYFISSADWMSRNLDRRLEVTCPIYDASIQEELNDYVNIIWSDTVKTRIHDEKRSNRYYQPKGAKKIRAQYEIYKYFCGKLSDKCTDAEVLFR